MTSEDRRANLAKGSAASAAARAAVKAAAKATLVYSFPSCVVATRGTMGDYSILTRLAIL